MKNIIVSQRIFSNVDYYEIREALDIRWGALFEKLNFLPIIAPFEYTVEKYFENIKIDGIILTGGNDLSLFDDNDLSKKRDKFEKNLISYGLKHNIPIFGVCRGMQVIAEYFGSSFEKVDKQVAIYHKLTLNKDSKFYSYLLDIDKVNSFHNYGIKRLSSDFKITAWNEDKTVIKAIEHKDYKVFGQMWHSEREDPFDVNELKLISNFFND